MKKHLSLIIVAVLISLGITGYASAQKGSSDGKGYKAGRIQKALKLTDDQQQKFNDFRYEHQNQVIDLKSQIEKNRLKIQRMMEDNNVNEQELKNLVKKNSDLQAQIKSSKVDMWLSVYKILNDEQKEMWTDHFGRMGHGKRGMHKKRDCRPGDGPMGFRDKDVN